jgi:hypothetical protein
VCLVSGALAVLGALVAVRIPALPKA